MAELNFFPELFAALWKGQTKEIEDNLESIRNEYNPTQSRPPEIRAAIGEAFSDAIRLSLVPSGKSVSYYPAILEMYLRHAKFYADQQPYCDNLYDLFTYPEILTSAYICNETDSVFSYDSIFAEHVNLIEPFISTPIFGRWAKLPGKMALLNVFCRRSLEMLVYSALNLCDILFVAQMRLYAVILSNVPELLPHGEALKKVFSCYNFRVFELNPDRRQELKTHLVRIAEHCKDPDAICLLNEFNKLVDTMPETTVSQAPEKLTVEAIYQAALNDIMADEILSVEEMEVIRNLREFVTIEPDVYQRIFDQQFKEMKENPRSEQTDFNAEIFMQKLISRYAGNLDEYCREMLIATGNALLLSPSQVSHWLSEPQKQSSDQPKAIPAPSWPAMSKSTATAITRLSELQSFSEELRTSPELKAISARAEEIYKVMSTIAAEKDADNKDKALEKCSLIAFLNSNESCKVPTIVYFVFSSQIHYARLQFKGDSINTSMIISVDEVLSRKSSFLTGDVLSLYNWDLDRAIKADCVYTDGIESFARSLEKSEGAYRLALVAYPSLTPIKILNNRGYIDMSGRYTQAKIILNQNKIQAAIESFKGLATDFPKLAEMSCMLGRCHKNLAQNGIDPENNYALAIKYYQEELAKAENSANAMLGLGIVYKKQGQFAEAEKWMYKAIETAPANISAITTLVATRMSRLMAENCSPNVILKDVCKHIAPCYYIDPENHVLRNTEEYLNTAFKRTVSGYVLLFPVDYRHM